MGLRLGVTTGRKASENGADEELSDLITQVTNEIDWLMREDKITRADLAARMGVSPGRVSQVLSGGENLTLRTLAALASALDAHFELELRPVADSQREVAAVREADRRVLRATHHESAEFREATYREATYREATFDEAEPGEYSRRR